MLSSLPLLLRYSRYSVCFGGVCLVARRRYRCRSNTIGNIATRLICPARRLTRMAGLEDALGSRIGSKCVPQRATSCEALNDRVEEARVAEIVDARVRIES